MDECFYCNSLMIGPSYYVDWKGNMACASHANIQRCNSCSCFLKSGMMYKEVESGRYICKDCLNNEVNEENFEWIKRQVMLRLYNVGFQDIQCDWVNFCIISKQQMSEDIGPGYAGYHTGISILNQTICVLSHTNKIDFSSYLAHELLHSWQMQNILKDYQDYSVNETSMKICEGFAQMGAWLIYDTIEHPYAKWSKEMMFKSENEVYGIPFQKIYARFKEVGWFGIIREARQHKLRI